MRPPRLDYAGARHHVTNRGNSRSNVFVDENDREIFLRYLARLPDRFGVEVHAWALNPNHYHLMLRSMDGRLSKAMRYLGSEYTRAFNNRHGTDGARFKGRFHNRVITSEAWWRHLYSYVHGNPVKDGFFDDPDACPWTSHRVYVGEVDAPEWLTTTELLEQFGDLAAYRTHLAGFLAGELDPPDGCDPEQLWAPHTSWGSPPAEPLEPHLALGEGLRELTTVTGLEADAFRFGKRGRSGNRACWVGAWWLTRRRGVTGGYLAKFCGVSAMTISKRVAMAEERRATDAQVGAWMDALEALPLRSVRVE